MIDVHRWREQGYEPFAFGYSSSLARLDAVPLGIPLTLISAQGEASLVFHRHLHRLNAWAFGGMGMPAWVQLDLGVLPSAFVGWTRRAADLHPTLRSALAPEADDDERVPVAEALAVPGMETGSWVSVSLATAVRGAGLGVATKALALSAYRAQRALGICQYDSPALRAHTAFGRLRVVDPCVSYHDKAPKTFIYSIDDVPSAVSRCGDVTYDADATPRPVDDRLAAHLQAVIASERSVWIAPPGFDGDAVWLVEQRGD
jgi:hypothetical protein